MNKFECIECGTRYTSTETTPPPGIKWIDGHVCAPKPVKDETKTKMYSEEEIIAFGEFIFKHSLLTHTRGIKSLFEQFKKK